MRVAILSGKGGTGKTLLSVNLAAAAKQSVYIDCDVEEPNGRLFFQPTKIQQEDVSILLPRHNPDRCVGCKRCVEFCKFNALAFAGKKLLVFDDVCHSCGGCHMLCPNGAITMQPKKIGSIYVGKHDSVTVCTGVLDIGEGSGVPIINQLVRMESEADTFIDCPPGSACLVTDSIKTADYCILVAEPTIFGVHNLNMVYELTQIFNKKCGVVLNKCPQGENVAEQYCIEHGITILGRIPWDKKLGEMTSNGKIAVESDAKYKKLFGNILNTVRAEV